MFYAPATRSCRASRSPPQADDKEPTMTDTSGRLFEMPWACWDPDSSSWRTYAGTSHSGSRKFSGTWPTSGLMRDGACCEHPTWGHPTSAPASSSVRGLPTPQARDGDPRGPQGKRYLNPARSNNLDDCVDALTTGLLPTQSSRDHKGRNQRDDTSCLPGAIHYLPTPTVQASKHAVPTPYERERYEAGGLDAYNLWVVVPMLFDGDRTDPPSNDGKPSTDPHQPPLPTEG